MARSPSMERIGRTTTSLSDSRPGRSAYAIFTPHRMNSTGSTHGGGFGVDLRRGAFAWYGVSRPVLMPSGTDTLIVWDPNRQATSQLPRSTGRNLIVIATRTGQETPSHANPIRRMQVSQLPR